MHKFLQPRILLAEFFVAFFAFVPFVAVAESPAAISVFVRADCGHCKDEKIFLTDLAARTPEITVTYLDIADKKNQAQFRMVTERTQLTKGTPLTLVRDTLIQGFDTADTTGALIASLIANGIGPNLDFGAIAAGSVSPKIESSMAAGPTCDETSGTCGTTGPNASLLVRLPLIGRTVDVGRFPLITITALLGFVDGFNPCALWVLLMFLVILAQVGSRKRMWQYAGLFVLAETIMYYLILNVWFTAWDFIALDRIVTPLVGLLALGSGVYFIYKFWTYQPTCTVTNAEQKQRVTARVRTLAARPLTLAVALGILALAFSVNIFEFACSIGIPQTFTKILDLNDLGFVGRQAYMLLYILMYMVDDFIAFGLALISIEKISALNTYSKWSSLVGGLLMLALGVILLVQPSLLIF